MKTFSIGAAIAEPFRQAGRRPVATIVWGLVLLAPSAIVLAAVVPLLVELTASGALDQGPGAEVSLFEDDFAAMMEFQIWSHLGNMAQLLTALLATTAIIRAVFAGRRRDSAAFLRIGMDELYAAVVGVSIGFGVFIAMFVAVLLAVGVGFALGGVPDPWRILIYVGMAVALAIGFLALWGRLALLAPASLRYDTFAFVEGWKLGRGQTWPLVGLMIVMFLVAIAIGVGVTILLMVVAMLVGGGLAVTDPETFVTWIESLPERPGLLIGLGVALVVPLAWIQGFFQLLATAPFARVVLDLGGGPEPAAAISADTTPNAD